MERQKVTEEKKEEIFTFPHTKDKTFQQILKLWKRFNLKLFAQVVGPCSFPAFLCGVGSFPSLFLLADLIFTCFLFIYLFKFSFPFAALTMQADMFPVHQSHSLSHSLVCFDTEQNSSCQVLASAGIYF